jgi:hypothetical protein
MWFGGDEHLLLLAGAFAGEVFVLLRRWVHGPHLVSHRKLRVASARGMSAVGVHARSCEPAADSDHDALRAVGHHLPLASGDVPETALRGSAALIGVEPQPAPGPPVALLGAGPKLQVTTAPNTPSGAPRPHVGGGLVQQPADVASPDTVTSAGVHRSAA